MKVGIIRCMQTEDYCPGTTDFKMLKEHKGAFEGINEEIELIGFCNCGGCPSKKAGRTRSRHDSIRILYSKRYAYRISLSFCKENERDRGKGFRRTDKAVRLYPLICGEKNEEKTRYSH